jgi:GNAT superfamily N-acetyltransferase
MVAAGHELRIDACGTERAADVHRLTQAAFARHLVLDPPSGAGAESAADVVEDLAAGGGAVAAHAGEPVGCLRWCVNDDGDFHVRRVAVDPTAQGAGIGRALMAWAEGEAHRRGCPGLSVGVRIALPDNQAFFRRLGFLIESEHRHDGYDHPTWLALRKPLDPVRPAVD